MTIPFRTCLRSFLFIGIAAFTATTVVAQDSPTTASAPGATMSRQQIITEGEKMADAQLAQLAGKKPDIDWVAGVMWAGYADFSHVSSKTAYTDAISDLGSKVQWTPPLLHRGDPNHADDLCIGQAFLDAYATKNDPARLAPTQSRLDALCAAIDQENISNAPGEKPKRLIWWWCDSLFMAPPGLARLSVVTKNPQYLEALDKEWWRTADLLYDKDEHLFARDATYLGKLAKNGKKIFWSRGNGWVFAGLARTLTYLPPDYPSRDKYVTIFKDMAVKLASLQQADGTWRPSLLDPGQYPDPEASGTALDCYAFAWGINHGILDRATYLPVAAKAWAALLAARRPDGLLGYVQGVAKAPDFVKADGTQLYATGAFLMDVCELSQLAPLVVPPAPQLYISAQENAGTPPTQNK